MKDRLKDMAQDGKIPFDIYFIRNEKPIKSYISKNLKTKKNIEVKTFYKPISRMI